MSKGSKRRPTNESEYTKNWDRIFNKDNANLAYESDNPLERPYNPPPVWQHYCKNNGHMSIGKGEACSWCGLYENGTLD